MPTPINRQQWDLYKSTIEKFVIDGWAPFRVTGGKGSSVEAAAQYLLDNKLTTATARSFLLQWVHIQEQRAAQGKEHWLPDWSLYPPAIARSGKLGFDPVLPGFEIKETSTTTDANGEIVRQRVTQAPAVERPFELPAGHQIKGISAYLTPDGRVKGSWVKTKEGPNPQLTIEAIKATFEEYSGRAELAPPPAETDADLLTTYVIGDHHLGMYAWGEECGEDYDLSIGYNLLYNTTRDLVARSPAADTAVILSLGDFFHTDTSLNRTERSHNALDVDTRRTKVLQVGVKLMIAVVELAAQKHRKVIVRCLPGNHDAETTPALAIALWAFFQNYNDRIEVDCSPSKFWYFQHGETMLAATHGDQCKIQDMPAHMASRQPKMWGNTEFRYAFAGHIHHKERIQKEHSGVICETFQVLPPADAWHAAMGYGAGRSMTSITYDAEYGEVSRNICSVRRK